MLSLKKYNIQSLCAIDVLFLLLLVYRTLWTYFNIVLSRLPYIGNVYEIVEPIVIITLIILSVPRFLKTLNVGDYLFYTICILIFFVHYIVFINNQIYLDPLLIKFPLYVLPFYFIGRTIDYEKNSNLITALSILSILSFSVIRFVVNMEDDKSFAGGDMNSAFLLLPFIILTLLDAFKTKNIVSIGVSIYSFFLLLSFGNRGGLLYALVYLSILIFHTLKSSRFKWQILVLFGIIGSCLYIFYDLIFMSLYVFLEQNGFSLRILEKILEDELTDSSGRDRILIRMFDSLSHNPMGLGVGGDRVIFGVYVHNLFVEFLSIFGYFGGGIVIFLFLRLIYKAYKAVVNTELSLFYIALICFGCLPLMTSMSFLEYPFFFLLLGYSVQILKKKKYRI